MPEDRAADIGNMPKTLVKIARVVPEIFMDRQTDRQTHRQAHRQIYSLQYFANAPASEVTKVTT